MYKLLKKFRIKGMFVLGILWTILLIWPNDRVFAQSIEDFKGNDFDYTEIQHVIDNVLESDDKVDFEKYVIDLVTGDNKFSIEKVGSDIKNGIKNELKENIGTLTSLISIAVVAAVFTNISYAFQSTQVAETGFYVAYLLMFSILTAAFISASSMASNTLTAILNFMKALIPTYYLSVAFTSGAGTSMMYYQVTLIIIAFVNVIFVKLIIPMINIYLIVSMANNISKEDVLSKLAELLSVVVKWLSKSLIAFVIGINTVQGLIVPVAANVKKNTLLKAAGAIPGIGDVLGSVTESVIGAGVLLKNAIGVAGVVVILVICAVPILKLTITTLIFRISSASVQPISDKRMLNLVSASAEAATLLLQTVIAGAVLFLLTITIVAATTTYK